MVDKSFLGPKDPEFRALMTEYVNENSFHIRNHGFILRFIFYLLNAWSQGRIVPDGIPQLRYALEKIEEHGFTSPLIIEHGIRYTVEELAEIQAALGKED